MPGDSPMGYRLPLDSLPWVSGGRPRRRCIERDPFAPRPPLPARDGCAAERRRRQLQARAAARRRRRQPGGPAIGLLDGAPRAVATNRRAGRRAHGAVRRSRATACSTSSCRRSAALEDYLDLVAAIEDTAAAARHARPARRLSAAARSAAATHFTVTPDPGVIEVNVQPATTGTSSSSRRRRCTKRRSSRG